MWFLLLHVKNDTTFTLVHEGCLNYPTWRETNNLFTLLNNVSKNQPNGKKIYQTILVGHLKGKSQIMIIYGPCNKVFHLNKC